MELLLGDCLSLMQQIPDNSIDMVCCDLPYGSTQCKWDVIIPFESLWVEYNRICKPTTPILLFGQEPFSSLLRCSNLKDYRYDWYWEKERLTNISQVKRRAGKTVETISVFYKKQPVYHPQMTVYTGPPRTNKIKNGKLGALVDQQEKKPYPYQDNGLRYPTQVLHFQRDILTCNLHATQKPIAQIEYLVRTFTDEGMTVLDNCMGSGTTGAAAAKLNREFIGIERDPIYFEIARERISHIVSQQDQPE